MRHVSKIKPFHRKREQRLALFRALSHALIMKGKIETTTAKAKYVRPIIEKLVTRAKKQNLASLRILIERLPKASAMKLYNEIAPKYKTRAGGYTRITKLPLRRRGDDSQMSVIEFI